MFGKSTLRWTQFIAARLMPAWILVFAAVAMRWSSAFTPWSHATAPALGFVLFIMGLILDLDRLRVLVRTPWQVLTGSLGKWMIASGVAVVLGYLFFGRHSPLTDGLIMAGVVPSGTSANLNAMVARGDLPLSIAMSAVDTFVGPLVTPALSTGFAGSGVHMAYWPFVWKMALIVFFPLAAGIVLQMAIPVLRRAVQPIGSILSALALYVVVLGVVAPASGPLLEHVSLLLPVVAAVVLQILLQMGLGYLYARAVRFDIPARRSMIFEVGICNTALAAVLATQAFGPMAGVVAMANMVCNLTLGSLAAVWLGSRPAPAANPAAAGDRRAEELG